MNLAALKARRESVLDGILHHGLKQHAGKKGFERVFINFLEDLEFVAAEANHFDVEIVVNEGQLFAQRNKGFVFTEQPAQDIGKLENYAAGHVRIEANQRRHRVQRI